MEEENKRPMTDSTTILIIEDDADLLDGLSFSLASEGYQVPEKACGCSASRNLIVSSSTAASPMAMDLTFAPCSRGNVISPS